MKLRQYPRAAERKTESDVEFGIQAPRSVQTTWQSRYGKMFYSSVAGAN